MNYERQYRAAKKARMEEQQKERALCLAQLHKLDDKQYEEFQSLYAMQLRDLGNRHLHRKAQEIDYLHKTRPPLTMLPAKLQGGDLGTAVSRTRFRRLALPEPHRGGGGPGSPPGAPVPAKRGALKASAPPCVRVRVAVVMSLIKIADAPANT